ncbi:MAG: hypothetical protein ACI3ZK_02025, partial [Candidatus Cryptobacteroides sp.]
MKKFFVIFASCVLFLSSCLSEILDGRKEPSGSSDIVLSLSSKAQTKAGGAKDGDKMSNLHIWLVKGEEVKGYLSQEDADLSIAADGTTATATFRNVERGACTLYLVANLPADCDLPIKYTVNSAIDSDFLKYVLPAVDGNTHEPPYGDTTPGMPLSTTLNMSVGAGTNRVSAELVRCCAKITLTIRNNTLNNTIILKDLAFTEYNPNTGYLFRQDDFSIPSSAYSFVPFKTLALQYGDTTSDVIKHGETRTYIQQYMYETEDGGASSLGFEIKGGLFADDVDKATVGNVVIGQETVCSVGDEVTSSWPSSPCLIKSYSYGYLYDNNSTVSISSETNPEIILSSDNYKNFLWSFSGSTTGTTTITNYATNKTISISNNSVTLPNTGTTVQSSFSSTYKCFSFASSN